MAIEVKFSCDTSKLEEALEISRRQIARAFNLSRGYFVRSLAVQVQPCLDECKIFADWLEEKEGCQDLAECFRAMIEGDWSYLVYEMIEPIQELAKKHDFTGAEAQLKIWSWRLYYWSAFGPNKNENRTRRWSMNYTILPRKYEMRSHQFDAQQYALAAVRIAASRRNQIG